MRMSKASLTFAFSVCLMLSLVSVVSVVFEAQGVQVGVKTGDWIKYDYTTTGVSYASGSLFPQWFKVEFLSVVRTNATVRVTRHMSDGTEQNETVPMDVVAGGQAFGLSGFVIPANLTTGDIVYTSGYGNVTITGETTGSYAGASRTVVHASFSYYGTQITYDWDKQTGIMVDTSTTSGTVTGTDKATETNMWQAQPFGLAVLYALIIAVVVIVVIAVFLVIRGKNKKPSIVEIRNIRNPSPPSPPASLILSLFVKATLLAVLAYGRNTLTTKQTSITRTVTREKNA